MSSPELQVCELCDRPLAKLTVHHLIPRQKTKRQKQDPGPTCLICSACHRQIHTLFDNHHLAKELNSLEALRNDPQMAKFLTWVAKQNPERRVKVDRRQA